jgi:hypothetical protein
MKRLSILIALLIAMTSCAGPGPLTPDSPTSAPSGPGPAVTTPGAAPATPVPSPGDPFSLISQESMFASMEALTAIQPYSGWRNSATQGEQEALDYVEAQFGEMDYLQELGLHLERQSFRVFLGVELWETRLYVTVGGQEAEVPADGLRGDRDDIDQALRFDSDGTLNDAELNPVTVQGPIVVIRSADEIRALNRADVQGRIVFLDYAVIDRAVLGRYEAVEVAASLLEKSPAGLVLVTQFSDAVGESHGSFVGDLPAVNWVETAPAPPTLYVRLEDMAPAGIATWDDLTQIEAARLTWDADVFSPADSGNLVAHIPGADSSAAMIVGAHIDSPNSPGAMDDGSGSVILLEIARVLDAAQVQPPTDLVLVWFGSEELGLYGSYHFASTHQELLDRTHAMLQIDMLSNPLDGIDAYLNLITWSYGRLGDDRLAWPDYLVERAERQGLQVYPSNYYGIESDNSAFTGFDVPSANLIYMDHPTMESVGGVHYACHIHDPYDTVELAREVGDVLEQMARVALTAALETGREAPDLRVTDPPDRRAVFVASHTEPIQMSPTTFTDLGMALAWEGFDVDLIPYGQAVTAADLADADLVVALPVLDYPSPEADPGLYDEAWSDAEVAALEAYVEGGGFLVLTNSAHRLKYVNWVQDLNEDSGDVNALAMRFGVTFREGVVADIEARVEEGHPLVEGVVGLQMAQYNGVPFDVTGGRVLARAGGETAVALLDHGEGEVLVLADVGMLNCDGGEPVNLPFWLNMARYARGR